MPSSQIPWKRHTKLINRSKVNNTVSSLSDHKIVQILGTFSHHSF